MKNTAPLSTPTSTGRGRRSRARSRRRAPRPGRAAPPPRRAPPRSADRARAAVGEVHGCGRIPASRAGRRRACARSRTASRSRPSDSRSTPRCAPPARRAWSVSARGRRSGRPGGPLGRGPRSTITRSAAGHVGQPVEVDARLRRARRPARRSSSSSSPRSSAVRAMFTSAPGWTRRSAGITSCRIRLRRRRVSVLVCVDSRGSSPCRAAPLPRLGRGHAQQRPGDRRRRAGASPGARGARRATRAGRRTVSAWSVSVWPVAIGRPRGVLAGGRVAGLAGARLEVRPALEVDRHDGRAEPGAERGVGEAVGAAQAVLDVQRLDRVAELAQDAPRADRVGAARHQDEHRLARFEQHRARRRIRRRG